MASNESKGYREQITADIHDCIEEMQCRPIIFAGAGLSRRYLGLPDWRGLLDLVRSECPQLDKALPYYVQKAGSLPAVATLFASAFQEYAWTDAGKHRYPDNLYIESARQDIYLKYSVKCVLERLTSSETALQGKKTYDGEIRSLNQIRPFAIVTTNYDTFLEDTFSDFQVTVGEAILRSDLNKIGDLLKIHGCVSSPESMVLTESDYADYNTRQRYLSAKLLTYFLEHPIVFVGYSVNDPNIQEILSHIDLVLRSAGGCIANIYILNYSNTPESEAQKETIVPTVDHRNVRVKLISTSDFRWVFEALGHQAPVEMDVRVLRTLESQIRRLVRTDYSNGNIEVDYKAISSLASGQAGKLTVIGLTPLVDLAQSEAHYRHTISAVAEALNYNHWNKVNELIKKIETEKGKNIKSYDNVYHQFRKYGKNTYHKYSDDFIELLKLVQEGDAYEIKEG